MMPGRQWVILAQVTMDFISVAKEYNFCVDLVKEIKEQLFTESPFPNHHKKRKGKNKT